MKAVRIFGWLLLLAAAWVGGYGYGRWYGPKSGADAAADAKPKSYFCPMHPQVRDTKPGDCPICGMKLVAEGGTPGAATGGAAEAEHEHDMPEGTIRVSPEKQQLIGVKYGAAEETVVDHGFRANGKVVPDERRFVKVQTRIEGWVDKVFVDFTGKPVEKGQPLLTLYSPELVATQQEYLLARKNQSLLRDAGPGLVAAARARLERFDLSEDQIRQMEAAGEPLKTITLFAPMAGTVMARNAYPKQRVGPETELYTLAGLDEIWVLADVFESDAGLVREGMAARVTTPYGAGGPMGARVDFVQPGVDPQTRTLKVRLNVPNPGMRLKPEMFVDVEFRAPQARRLTVPSEAVLDAGLKKTVFVDRGNGYLEPRAVETGEVRGGRTEIVRGLKAGERVVTSGTFLIDSEAQLKSAAGAFEKKSHDQPHH